MSDIKRIDIAEFREIGFLQEVNRQFFHPLGLALEVVIEDCDNCGASGIDMVGYPATSEPCPVCGGNKQTERLGGVWDYRDDPEGMVYGSGEIEQDKIDRVAAVRQQHAVERERLLGAPRVVQEPGDEGL